MIISDLQQVNRKSHLNRYFIHGTIFDTCVLYVFLLDKYTAMNSVGNSFLKKLSINKQKRDCLNTIISRLKINHIIITPHILAEFLNGIRRKFKEDYKKIKNCVLQDLKNFEEIPIAKNHLLNHNKFVEFGNDVSMTLATQKQIEKFNYSSIMSFDGRYIRNHFKDSKNEILAFDLDTIQYFF